MFNQILETALSHKLERGQVSFDKCVDHANNQTIRISLIDFIDTTARKIINSGHRKGNCKCSECDKLRKLENKWLGTFYVECGLNARNVLFFCCLNKFYFSTFVFTLIFQKNVPKLVLFML